MTPGGPKSSLRATQVSKFRLHPKSVRDVVKSIGKVDVGHLSDKFIARVNSSRKSQWHKFSAKANKAEKNVAHAVARTAKVADTVQSKIDALAKPIVSFMPGAWAPALQKGFDLSHKVLGTVAKVGSKYEAGKELYKGVKEDVKTQASALQHDIGKRFNLIQNAPPPPPPS